MLTIIGSDMIPTLWKAYDIDVFLSICDLWVANMQWVMNAVKQANVIWAAHVTLNTQPLAPQMEVPISLANYVVAPSKFNVRLINNAGYNCIYIPHGVDLDVFKPLSDEEKKKIRKDLKVDDKTWIALSVMRNKGFQKNFPALIYAWKLFLENKPELRGKAVLLILSDPLEPEGIRIDIFRARSGLVNDVRFIWAKPNEKGILIPTFEDDKNGFLHNANYTFSAEEMARIYNAADIHITSSCGESFGLPIIESLACGLPNIATNFSTGPELIGEPKTGLLAKVGLEVSVPLISDIAYVDPIDLGKCIIKMYEDKNFREECKKNALEFVKGYDWNVILPKWIRLFETVEKDKLLKTDYVGRRLGI